MQNFICYTLSAWLLMACSNGKPSAQTDNEEQTDLETSEYVEEQNEAKPVYNTTDALSFGLKGQVKNVTTQILETYESSGELKEGNVTLTKEMTFDAWGHVTQDEWGNNYGYDADGNFYRGNFIYTIVKRDKAGRICQYIDYEPNAAIGSNQTMTFIYDKSGRQTSIEREGCTSHWVQKHHYQGKDRHATKIECNVEFADGGTAAITYAYTYLHFDELGNWTERVCLETRTETREALWEDDNEDTTITETVTVEKRSITYYETTF